MRAVLLAALALQMLFAPVASWANDTAKAAIVRDAIDRYIRPGFRDFSDSTHELHGAMGALCAMPSDRALAAARAAFRRAVIDWSGIEFVQIGPAREGNRLERILFFPDRRGIGLRQIQALLAEQDDTFLAPGTLPGRSAALQGLPALEHILFGSGSQAITMAPHVFACDAGQAIAANVASMADEIVAGWQAEDGIAALLTWPGAENQLYANRDEALAAILKIAHRGYELVEETRIAPFFGYRIEKARPKAALWWRSGLTRDALAANLAGLARLVEDSGMLAHLARDAAAFVPGEFEAENKKIVSLLGSFGTPLPDAAQDPDLRARLDRVRQGVSSLRELAETVIVDSFRLAAGFSSLDGD